MDLRDNILIQRDALSPVDLALLRAAISVARMTDSLVSNFADEAPVEGVEWILDKQIRDTQEVHLESHMVDRLGELNDTGARAYIEPFYGVEVRDREPLQVLHYGVGGHYVPHVDAETLYKDDNGLDLWEKTMDRDLSVVYFLNDDFSGGELVFPALDVVVTPVAGTLVCFPADHNYIHGVRPVTAGHRYTLVTWMRVKGMPTMDEINEVALTEYHRQFPKQVAQPPRVVKGGRIKGRP